MIYSKLPVVFLTHLASEKQNSTNSQIASYILANLDQMQHLGIKEIAKECHVATSSISRFCKEIGLRDFNELKELLQTTDLRFETPKEQTSLRKQTLNYRKQLENSLKLVEESIDYSKIVKLCKDIYQYKKVAVFGLLKASTVAFNLQTDLLMLGKQAYTSFSYKQQIEYILNSDEQDLILILSYTGSYFDYHDLRKLQAKLKKPKIWLISSSLSDLPNFVNDHLYFKSNQDQTSHPYQLQFISGIIAQQYANLIQK